MPDLQAWLQDQIQHQESGKKKKKILSFQFENQFDTNKDYKSNFKQHAI